MRIKTRLSKEVWELGYVSVHLYASYKTLCAGVREWREASVGGKVKHLQSRSQVGHQVAVQSTQHRHDGEIEDGKACKLGRGGG